MGYGICQRLLVQLTSQIPSDSLPQDFEDASLSGQPQKYTGLTLIMACRSVSRAQKARNELLQFFDSHIQQIQSSAEYDGHAEEFKKNLSVEVEYVDLASIKTVLEFAKRVNQKYVFFSVLIHLIYRPYQVPLYLPLNVQRWSSELQCARPEAPLASIIHRSQGLSDNSPVLRPALWRTKYRRTWLGLAVQRL